MTSSSPMTATSHSAASELPALTNGTTAQSSPSPLSRSPSLTPPPPASKGPTPTTTKAATKRKSEAAANNISTPKAKKSKKDQAEAPATEEKPEKGTYCHQCRTKCEPEGVIRCTRLRKYTKATPARACNLAWCERDLEKRYEIDPDAIRARGQNVSAAELEKHDADKEYVFSCPCCEDECQNSTCRKKKGLGPLGDIVKLATQAGCTPLEIVQQTDAGTLPNGKSRGADDDESELSDLDAPSKPKVTPKKGAAATKKATPKAAAASKDAKTGKGRAKPSAKDAKGKGKAAATGKDAKTKAATAKDTKTKAKDAKAKEKEKEDKVKAKAKAIAEWVEPPVAPPFFNPVDTRMNCDEVEQRLYVREFMNRFRVLLNLPDRALGPLDNFDQALTEASVRTLAGALLDLIIADGGASHGIDFTVIESVEEKREELRSAYADLGRFAQIFREVADWLDLEMPPAVDTTRERNSRAVRALLELGVDEPTPSWAIDSGPSRRGASRIPQPSEVIRMLMALIDFVIHLEAVRQHMDPAVFNAYGDELRKNVQFNKEENARWEAEKKSLMAARVRCKTAEQTKANKVKFDDAQHQHNMRMREAYIIVNTVQQRKVMRFAPLGTDSDGRVYYALTPRLIHEERYRPSGWTKGVMVWGPSIEGQDSPDGLPWQVERWMYFNTADDTRQLGLWLAYMNRKQVKDMEKAAAAGNGDVNGVPKTPKGKANGVKANGTPAVNGTALDSRPVSRRTSTLEGKVKAKDEQDDDDNSDTESELSSAPSTRDDLLALLDPPGYTPSIEAVKDQYSLVMGVQQVAGMLEVLEWRGIR